MRPIPRGQRGTGVCSRGYLAMVRDDLARRDDARAAPSASRRTSTISWPWRSARPATASAIAKARGVRAAPAWPPSRPTSSTRVGRTATSRSRPWRRAIGCRRAPCRCCSRARAPPSRSSRSSSGSPGLFGCPGDPRFAGMTVSAVALAAGFGDLSHFNRSFRRRYGATPSVVREVATRLRRFRSRLSRRLSSSAFAMNAKPGRLACLAWASLVFAGRPTQPARASKRSRQLRKVRD